MICNGPWRHTVFDFCFQFGNCFTSSRQKLWTAMGKVNIIFKKYYKNGIRRKKYKKKKKYAFHKRSVKIVPIRKYYLNTRLPRIRKKNTHTHTIVQVFFSSFCVFVYCDRIELFFFFRSNSTVTILYRIPVLGPAGIYERMKIKLIGIVSIFITYLGPGR